LGCQVPATLVAENGQMVRLAPGPAEVVGHVPSGRLAMDGTRLVAADGEAIKARRRMQHAGAAVATVVLDRKGRLAVDPVIALPGLVDGSGDDDLEAEDLAVDAVIDAVEGLKPADLRDDATVEEKVRVAVRRSLRGSLGKRPMTKVQIIRL
jgi:ribonuclease J